MPYSYLIDTLTHMLIALLQIGSERRWNFEQVRTFVRDVVLTAHDNNIIETIAKLRDEFVEGRMMVHVPRAYVEGDMMTALERTPNIGIQMMEDRNYKLDIRGRRLKLIDARNYVRTALIMRDAWMDQQAGCSESFVKDE